MALIHDLKTEVSKIFTDTWTASSGRVVPVPSSVGLGNKAVEFDSAAVLYADLDGSTNMVDSETWQFSAEIYKTFLHCAAKIVKAEGGTITAYDGDRIMAVFIGDAKSDRAARCGLKINYAVKNIVQPAMQTVYKSKTFSIAHVVGIDLSPIRIARTGVRGDNDLVWVGRAANYAAKLTALSSDYPTRITKAVYNELAEMKTWQGKSMWETRSWTAMNNMTIYRSSWTWQV